MGNSHPKRRKLPSGIEGYTGTYYGIMPIEDSPEHYSECWITIGKASITVHKCGKNIPRSVSSTGRIEYQKVSKNERVETFEIWRCGESFMVLEFVKPDEDNNTNGGIALRTPRSSVPIDLDEENQSVLNREMDKILSPDLFTKKKEYIDDCIGEEFLVEIPQPDNTLLRGAATKTLILGYDSRNHSQSSYSSYSSRSNRSHDTHNSTDVL